MPRRIAIIATATGGALFALLLPSGRPVLTEAPSQPVPAPHKYFADEFDLGTLMEGDGPPLERLHPSAPPTRPLRFAQEVIPAPEGYTADFRRYLTPEEINTFLDEIEADYPSLVEQTVIGTTWRGRPIRAIRVANESVPGDIADRAAVYVDGQHHAREFISHAVPLYTLWWLVHAHGRDPFVTHLVDTRAVYIVPSVNPDGNQIALTGNQVMRGSANPNGCDDDGDGAFDEDFSEGYGYGAHELWLYHFAQGWADAHPDNPFVDDWFGWLIEPAEAMGRFTGAFGGPRRSIPRIDQDGDGQWDEDEIGAVDPNRNYEAHWERGDAACRRETYRGPAAFSERESQAVRDFVGAIPHAATALSFHSGVDRILHPWGWSRTAELPDAEMFELLGRKGSQLTEVNGFDGSPHTWTARGLYAGSGSAMDYLYEKKGVFAFTPEVYGGSYTTSIERVGSTGTFTVGESTGAAYNPPVGEILATADRWNRFALYILAVTPNIELQALAVAGGTLVMTVGNDGVLPVEVSGTLFGEDNATLASFGPETLALTRARWSVPASALAGGPARLVVTADLVIGTVPHRVERAAWTIAVDETSARATTGRVVPFFDLGAHFEDGWWADERWDELGRYHLPPGNPIPATAPATPTPGPLPSPSPSPSSTPAWAASPPPTASTTPSSTPTASRTPTATANPTRTPGVTTSPTPRPPTVSPTPTPTPTPGWRAPWDIFLPSILRRS